jgi:uncharacterized RDD family membrane protein YckC
MTEQPPPAPQEQAQESPPPAAPPPSSGWTAPASASAPAAAAPGGLVYADVPNRAIAYIVDGIILFVINLVVGIVLGGILGPSLSIDFNSGQVTTNWGSAVVSAIVSTIVTGVYFIYTWTSMRGSPGQKMLGMQVGNASDGATITMEQAIRRWIFLGAPFGIASAFAGAGGLGLIIGLAGFAYFIYLLVSTAQSPTKQGFHDKQANTVVVKAARSVA